MASVGVEERAGLGVEIFVARQPILDCREEVVAYELLFRSDAEENFFSCRDGDEASLRLVNNSLFAIGLDSLTAGRKAFINLTPDLLLQELATVLPPEKVVIEIIETVKPDERVVAACRDLKQAGYLLALDDFQWRPELEPLVALADFVKVDFLATEGEERGSLVERLAPRGIQMVAEKVETQSDFKEAKRLGYSYFQGYFFCRPEIVSGTDIPSSRLNNLRILQEIGRPTIDIERLSFLVKREMSFTTKLLRFINSYSVGLRRPVKSIEHAILLLGEQRFKKWASVVAFAGMCGKDKPQELLILSLVRAQFCELLGRLADPNESELDLFLTGMLSAADAVLDLPLADVLSQISVSPSVQAALLEHEGRLGALCELILAIERGDWQEVSSLVRKIPVDEADVGRIYQQSVAWAAPI